MKPRGLGIDPGLIPSPTNVIAEADIIGLVIITGLARPWAVAVANLGLPIRR